MTYGKFKMGREISNQGSDSRKKRKTIGGGQKIGPAKKNPKPKPENPGRIGIDDWRKINKPKRYK